MPLVWLKVAVMAVEVRWSFVLVGWDSCGPWDNHGGEKGHDGDAIVVYEW